jgi:tetratricopeptide (TPR) repeat protein
MTDELALAELLNKARTLVDERKFLHAVQVYRKITEQAPAFDGAWIELAGVFSELKRPDAAEHALLEARNCSGDQEEVTMLLGNLKLKQQDYEKALLYYRELADVERELPARLRIQLTFHLGLVHLHRNNVRLAEELFRKTLSLNPRFPKINESIAELLLRREAYAEALGFLQTAIAVDQYSWIAHYLLGIVSMRTLDWRKAHEEFVTAIDMDPQEPTAWQLCGEVLIALHELDEAEQYLRKALELNPQSTDAAASVGAIHLKRGDYQRARECFEKALALDPKHGKALQGKAELSVVTKQLS